MFAYPCVCVSVCVSVCILYSTEKTYTVNFVRLSEISKMHRVNNHSIIPSSQGERVLGEGRNCQLNKLSNILLCMESLSSGIWAARTLPLCLPTSPAIWDTNSLLLSPSGQSAHSRLEIQSSHLFFSPLGFTKHFHPYVQ